MWSTGERNGNPLLYPCLENPNHTVVCKGKKMTLEDEPPRSAGVQYANGEESMAITNGSRKNEADGPKQKQHSVVDVASCESKVPCCKEHYCLRTWNVRSMNQDKLGVVKQEMARLNVDIRLRNQ